MENEQIQNEIENNVEEQIKKALQRFQNILKQRLKKLNINQNTEGN